MDSGLLAGSPDVLKPLFRMSLLKGATPSVLLHIRRGAPLNGRDDRGLTPLMLAGAAGRHDICLLLLAEGADPGLITRDGRTASDLALAAGHLGLGDALRPVQQTRSVPETRSTAGASEPVDRDTAATDEHADAFFATGDWDAEEAFVPVTGDLTVSEATRLGQASLATRGENPDASWQDIALVLPVGPVRRNSLAPEAVMAVLSRAVSAEWSSAPEIRRACRQLPGLKAVLDDLGVRPETPFGALIARNLASARPDGGMDDRLGDAADLVAALADPADARALYAAELKRMPYVDRASEQSMFRALGDARKLVARSLVAAIPLAGALLNPVAGALPDGIGSGNHSDEDGPADLSEEGMAEADPGDLLSVLRKVREGAAVTDDVAALDVDLGTVDALLSTPTLAADYTGIADRLRQAVARYVSARNRVIEANLPLVAKVAGRYRRRDIDLSDLVQEGNIGLMRAVDRFDPSRGNRFSTFAIWWIRQACGRVAEDLARTIRLPVHVVEACRRVSRSREALTTSLDRAPDILEIADDAGVSPEKVRSLTKAWRRTVSLEDPRVGGYGDRVHDNVSLDTFGATLDGERRRIIRDVLMTLTMREERVVRARFGLGGVEEQTLEELGTAQGVTRERIRQIEHQALVRLVRHASPQRRRLRALL